MSDIQKQISFDYDGKLERRFTQEWSESGVINLEKIPDVVRALVIQRQSLVNYVKELQDKVDDLMQKHNICPWCDVINCGSDHA